MKLKAKLSLLMVVFVLCSLFILNGTILAQDSLEIAIPGKAQTLDPAFLKRIVSEWPIMNCVYNGLVKYKPGTFEVVPDLATDWEISDNNKEITFNLRRGIKFHRGYGEFTAKDVKFSYERIIDPENNSPEAQSFAALERVEIVDDYTVKLILSEPMARLFTSTLPFYPGLIVSREAVRDMGREDFAHNPVGTGPLAFKEWGLNNNIVLTRNDNYWDKKASFGRVEFVPMPDITSQEMALQSGEIDVGQVTLDNIDRMKQEPGLEVKTYPDLAAQWIAFNVQQEPMNDRNLREALRYIIDPEEILLGAFAGKAERSHSMLLPSMLGYWQAPAYNVDDVGREKVMELLAEAGYPEGEGLELTYVTDANDMRRQIATIIQAQLAEFNIKLNIETMEIGPKIDRWQKGDYHITYTRFGNTVDPGYCMQWHLSEQIGSWNLMHWSNEKYDLLWERAEKIMEEDKRAEFYKEMQKIMDEAAIVIWTTHGVKTPTWNADIDPVFSPDGVVLPWLVEKK